MANPAPILTDKWGRIMNYLRIAVTDRCNLRCFYCMPAEGIKYLPKKELLSYEELLRIATVSAQMGVNKIRLTGGEPFVRNGLIDFISDLNTVEGIDAIHLTTNGVLTFPYLDRLHSAGVRSVNLSLDTLDRKRFEQITRRDELPKVMQTFHGLIERNIKTKINMVVMDGKNTDDILPMLSLAKQHAVEVRFIEEMPFNGDKNHQVTPRWNHQKILHHIEEQYGKATPIASSPGATARLYKIDTFAGSIGIIPAFSRTFCDTCNRLRITSQGTIKSCLYDEGVLDLRHYLRKGATDDEIKQLLAKAVNQKAKDGFEAEKSRSKKGIEESMSTIGG